MERRVSLSASIAHATTHSLELTFAALLLRIGLEFGADLASLGAVANVGTFTFGATALPSGYLSDRFGPRAVMSSCMAAGALFAGWSPSLRTWSCSRSRWRCSGRRSGSTTRRASQWWRRCGAGEGWRSPRTASPATSAWRWRRPSAPASRSRLAGALPTSR